jgi:TonB-linked SusC/RagA family outer membrane protein
MNMTIMVTLVLCCTRFASAQTMNIFGRVIAESGEGIAGASVVLVGSSRGILTDAEGRFTFNDIPSGSKISFSALGMESQTLVATKEEMHVTMRETAITLQEVVSIGYGFARKEELTSAVAKIDSKAFNPGVVGNPINLITGKIPGLSIRNVAGNDPNAAPEVLLRGIGSIRAGMTPLIIIDDTYATMSDLNALNIQDIESFNVLRDGASAAIYGTRGSNGVIIIETKKGSSGAGTIEYSSYYFVENPVRKLEVMSASEYLGLLEKKGLSASNNDYGFSTDWFDQIVKPSFGHNQNISFSKGNDNSQIRASIGYRKADGIVMNTGNTQTNGYITFKQYFLNQKLKIEGSASGSNLKMDYTDYGALMQALVYHPTAPVYDQNGNFFEFEGVGPYNPVALLSQERNRGERLTYSGNLVATLNLLDNLKITARIAHNNENYEGSKYISREARRSKLSNKEGFAETSSHLYKRNTLELYGTYMFSKSGHNATLVAGYSYNDEKRVWDEAKNAGFMNDQLGAINIGKGTDLAEGLASMGRGADESRLIAFFGRVNYSYLGKYLFNASIRREGSTRFGENNKWGWFPALSVGWRISEENFMKGLALISSLKLRAGYGLTGNQDIPRYESLAKFNDLGYAYYNSDWIKAYGPTTNTNPDLRWEKNSEYNIGIDAGLWNDRLTASIELYYRKTTDLLDSYDAQVPSSIYSTIFTNVGTLTNKGVEVMLNYNVMKSSHQFGWSIDAGFSYNKNELLSLSNSSYKANHIIYNTLVSPANGQPTYILEVGKPIGTYYGLKYKGIDAAGKWVFEDIEKDGAYDDKDYTFLGNGLPTWNFSLSNTFTYKGFDLSFQLRGAAGFDVLNVKRIYYENTVSLPFNLLRSTLDKNLNDAAVFSDYYLEKGDYLKLSNLTLGYTLNLDQLPYISSIRLYVTGTNLLTITSYTGVDPEVGSGLTPGFDNSGYYPRSAMFLFGLNINF